MKLCDDCLHENICKIKEDVKIYTNKIDNIPLPISKAISINFKCECKLTAPIPRKLYDGVTQVSGGCFAKGE